jgi:hypothetical protein
MSIAANSKGKLHISRRTILVIFVFLMLGLLACSVTFYMIIDDNDDSSLESSVIPPIFGDETIYVKTEAELRNAIIDAVNESVVIAPIEDIYLTNSALSIPDKTNVTLTIDSKYGVRKLFGAVGNSVIIVETGGVLTLNGLIITHENDTIEGNGIIVNSGGTIMMYSGMISGNTVKNGGGVYNNGIFKFYGGKISGNTATNYGGGLYNIGVFEMYGGEITNNIADLGGGVYNRGRFDRLGGVISDNKATSRGYNWA